MPVRRVKPTLFLEGECGYADAEVVLGWLSEGSRALVDLRACTHLHAAVLQVLLAARVRVKRAPRDPFLRRWIAPLLAAGADAAGRGARA
jgi:hypothetical protein